MKFTCLACGKVFTPKPPRIDKREERYNRAYEPEPVTCPRCGSDELR